MHQHVVHVYGQLLQGFGNAAIQICVHTCGHVYVDTRPPLSIVFNVGPDYRGDDTFVLFDRLAFWLLPREELLFSILF